MAKLGGATSKHPVADDVADLHAKFTAPTTDSDSDAFLAATGIVDPTQAAAVDALTVALKGAGLWTKMYAIYPVVGGTAFKHSFNLRNPATFQLTYTGTIAHTGNGMKPTPPAIANTHLTPQGTIGQDDVSLSYYSRTLSPATDRADMGAYNSPTAQIRTHLIINYMGDLFYFDANSTSGSNVSNATSLGMFANSRRTSGSETGYRNGAPLATASVPSVTLPDIPITLLSLNGYYPTGPSDLECAFATIGHGLTDSEQVALYTAVQTYQTALGRAV